MNRPDADVNRYHKREDVSEETREPHLRLHGDVAESGHAKRRQFQH